MNEKIKELAEQLGYDWNWTSQVDFGPKQMEKFAELIIRECYQHCKDQLMDKKLAEEAGLDYNDGVMDCAIGLKQHFGVVESKGWVCSNCGTDRTKQECPKGYTAALTGECPMIGVTE